MRGPRKGDVASECAKLAVPTPMGSGTKGSQAHPPKGRAWMKRGAVKKPPDKLGAASRSGPSGKRESADMSGPPVVEKKTNVRPITDQIGSALKAGGYRSKRPV